MNLKRAFLAVTVLAALAFGGAFAGRNALSDRIVDATVAVHDARQDILDFYRNSPAGRSMPSSLSREERFNAAMGYAGEDNPLVKAYDTAEHRLESLQSAVKILRGIAVGATYSFFLALAAAGATGLSRRARTRDQRAGLAVACLFGIPAAIFAIRHLDGPIFFWLADDFTAAPETYVCFAFLLAGAVTACGIPRKVCAWIASGAKD